MTDKQPSFSERRATMVRIAAGIAVIAKDLRGYADHIELEAGQMERAEKRFAERRSRNEKAGR